MTAEEQLRRWLTAKTGIELSRGGVQRTLSDVVERRCKELGCGIDEYYCRVQQPGSPEFDLLANAATVVYTWFFRDPKQLGAIEELLKRWSSPRPVRIWVPGCATGEDPYSIAMIAEGLGVPVSILGTDLNSAALKAATEARYSDHDLRNLDPARRRFFMRVAAGGNTLIPSVRQRATFLRHNLVDPVPDLEGRSDFDLILCRNVFIYFGPERALDVFRRLTRALAPGGHLLLGASEILYDVPTDLEVVEVAQRLVLRTSERPPGPRAAPQPKRGATDRKPAQLVFALPNPLPPRAKAVSAKSHLTNDTATKATRVTSAGAQGDDWLEQGHALLEESRVPEAVDVYTRALAADPVCAEALMYRGVARYLGGDVETAARDLRAALFLDGELWLGTYYLALSYESMGLADDALREFRHLVRVGGDDVRRPKAAGMWAGWSEDILQLARRRLEAGSARQPKGRS